MPADIPNGLLTVPLILALCSVVMMILQIVYKSRVNILTICKVSVFVPFVCILIKIADSHSRALADITHANDLNESILTQGFSSMWSSLSFGLLVTTFLAVLYGITVAVVKNQRKQPPIREGAEQPKK